MDFDRISPSYRSNIRNLMPSRDRKEASKSYAAIESKGPVTNYDVTGSSQDFLRRVNRQKAIMMTVF